MKLSGNKILITGGASGIGLGLTERFIKENNSVIVCGRRQELLDELKAKHPSLITYTCNLSKPEERENLYKKISHEHPDMNVLINNAGIQQWMNILDPNFFEKTKSEIAINIEAPLHLISFFQNHNALNTIINVTSGLSFVPMIKVPVYCSTKAFLHSFTKSLRELLRNKNIEVIELIPPALNTDLGGKGLHDFAPPVAGFIDSVFEQLSQGKYEITYGMSEGLSKSDYESLEKTFVRMNGL